MKAILVLLCLLVPSLALAQTVKNPTVIVFTASPDHALLSGYEADIKAPSGDVLATIPLPVTTPDANNDVRHTINVQPITFGVYTIVVRAVVGPLKGIDSPPSDSFERVPGGPGKPKPQ